jgi:hypothetical protein
VSEVYHHPLATHASVFIDLMSFVGRCTASPKDLDGDRAQLRTHEKTDFLIEIFDPGILWEEYGIRTDVVVSGYTMVLATGD